MKYEIDLKNWGGMEEPDYPTDAAGRLRWLAGSGYIDSPHICNLARSWSDEAAAERDALDARPTVPEGHEVVVLPSEVVDVMSGWAEIEGSTIDTVVAACRAAVERRPPVEPPQVERVPWWEAVGREDPEDGIILEVRRRWLDDGEFHVPEFRCGNSWFCAGVNGEVKVVKLDDERRRGVTGLRAKGEGC